MQLPLKMVDIQDSCSLRCGPRQEPKNTLAGREAQPHCLFACFMGITAQANAAPAEREKKASLLHTMGHGWTPRCGELKYHPAGSAHQRRGV